MNEARLAGCDSAVSRQPKTFRQQVLQLHGLNAVVMVGVYEQDQQIVTELSEHLAARTTR